MTMVLPLGWQVLDANGNPYSGAKAQFYATGTTTPQATYSESTLVTPNANPLVADSAGRFGPAYGPTTTDYKVVLMTSANVVIATFDPVQMTGAVAALSVGTTQIAAAAVTNAKLANMATQTVKMRDTAGTGVPEDVAIATVSNRVGGRRLLATLTAATSASLDFTLTDSTLYAAYEVEIDNLVCGTDNVSLYWRVSTNGGSSYLATGTYNNIRVVGVDPTTLASAGAATDVAGIIATSVGNTAARNVGGFLKAGIGGATAGSTKLNGILSYVNKDGGVTIAISSAHNQTASQINAFQILASSGTLSSGVARIYGIFK